MTLTVVIITKNEEKDLGRTLNSLKFADEVLVVDSGSTDKTIAIARQTGARVVIHHFDSYSEQRNFADSLVTNDWVLFIDGDVVITKELADEIRIAIEKGSCVAYLIGRINIIWGREVGVADWGPKDDNHIWLYKKGSGKWVSEVHEEFVTNSNTGQLKNNFIHYNYETVSEFIDKINSYSEIASNKKNTISWLSPIIDFGKRYLYKLGFTAGYHGLFLSYLQAVYYVTLKVKTWQKQYTQSNSVL